MESCRGDIEMRLQSLGKALNGDKEKRQKFLTGVCSMILSTWLDIYVFIALRVDLMPIELKRNFLSTRNAGT